MIEIDAKGGELNPEFLRSTMARIEAEVPVECLVDAVWQMSADRCAQWERCGLMVQSITVNTEPCDILKRALSTMGAIPIQRKPWLRDDYVILYPNRTGAEKPIAVIYGLGPIEVRK